MAQTPTIARQNDGQPAAVIGAAVVEAKWMPTGRPLRSAASKIGR